MKFLMALFILILICGGQARADCKADCQNEYQSEVQSCNANYDDPDDADDLKTCMDDERVPLKISDFYYQPIPI